MTTIIASPKKITRYGITLSVVPGDLAFQTQIQRATDSGFTANVTTVTILNPGDVEHTDILPNDNVTRWYRARHVLQGYTAGNWTAGVSGVPRSLDTKIAPIGFLTVEGRERVDTIYSADQGVGQVFVSNQAITQYDCVELISHASGIARVKPADADGFGKFASLSRGVAIGFAQAAAAAAGVSVPTTLRNLTRVRAAESWATSDIRKPAYVHTTAGQVTKTRPTAANARIAIAGIIADVTSGSERIEIQREDLGLIIEEILRPDSDVETTGWAVTPLWQKLDEIASDGDTTHIESTDLAISTPDFEIGLADLAASIPANATRVLGELKVTMRRRDVSGTPMVDASIELKETTTVRATKNVAGVGLSYQEETLTLTQTELDSIGDPNNLRVRVQMSATVGGDDETYGRVTWVQFRLLYLDPDQ